MGKKPSTKKSTSHKRCKGKDVTTPVAQNKAAKGKNNRSIVTSERGSSSTPYHKNHADHPLFGVRRYIPRSHNSSDPVLHVNVTDHLSYKEDQLTPVFILAVLGSTLCNDKSDSVYLYYIPSSVKVEEIKDYNWGEAGLACLYLSMNALSRGLVACTGGYWRAWEGIEDAKLHDYVQNSIPMTKQRILLQGPAGYAWYLGERIYVQSLSTAEPRVPRRPLRTMLKDMKVFALDKETKASLNGFNAEDWFAESIYNRVFRNEYVRYKHYPTITDNVSASTTTQLLDMISCLNFLLVTKCMVARTIISELRQKSSYDGYVP
ncbi:hypothetical protein ACE6H2_026701 [Prunus campanulata]